jgi:uncharacterized protein (DUF2236 family)
VAADSYADVSGLVERSAAAYASSVPEHPADDGFFGPGSVTWRLSTDLSSPMAGVDQHSDWRSDPVGRLAATSSYLTIVSVGDKATAERVSERVRRVHEHVRGVDTVTGQPYAAGDPALLLWVHAAFVDSNIAAAQLFGSPLVAVDADRYVAEMVAAAKLVGVPTDMVPASVAELERYIESVRPILRATPAARESMAYLLDPPGLDPDVAEIWQDIREGTIASLPDWARDMYGYSMAGPLTDARRTEIRQALGILDTVFLGEPGVLEARQRLALRMRAARVA